MSVKLNGHIQEVKVQSDNLRATCYVEGIWSVSTTHYSIIFLDKYIKH